MDPIRVSASGRYFECGGEPYFWLGDTQWELFRCVTAAEASAIVARRKEQGFSALHVMITGVGDGAKPNRAGQTPWSNNDPAHPNEAYFGNADTVVEEADRQGMPLILGVFHQLQVNIVTVPKARAYARWVARRYASCPNVIWSMYPKAEPEYAPVCRELGAGLREGDGGAHLISVHPDPSPTSGSFLHGEPWLDVNMIQTCTTFELIYPMVRADYELTPVRPVVMAEGGYEGEEFGRVQTALEIRKQAYWTQLAGGHHSYGHNDCWMAPERWRQWIDSPGASSLTIFREVVTSCPAWWNAIPDQSIFAEGEGSGISLNVAARSSEGDWALAYLASPAPIRVRPGAVTATDSAHATWIDPVTGGRTPAGVYPATNTMSFAPPGGWQDALLLITSR